MTRLSVEAEISKRHTAEKPVTMRFSWQDKVDGHDNGVGWKK